MTYYGLLHHDSKELTDISASVPAGRELEGDVVELDSMPDYRPGILLTYDPSNRSAIPHDALIRQRQQEREARLAMEASPEWRNMSDVEISEVNEASSQELIFPDVIASELSGRMEGRHIIDVPSEEAILELVKVAYFASLNPEESKLYPFTIAFLQTDGSPYWCPQRGWAPIVFKEPRPFGVDEITKLAPALDFSQAAVCVRQGEHGRLEIWGIVVTSRSVHKFREGSLPGFFWMGPRHLRIRVPQAGHLVFDDGITWLLEYRLGELVKDLLPVLRKDGPVFRFLQSFKISNKRSIPILYPFALLARRVLNMYHGGMIILVKDEEANEVINAVKVKYGQVHEFNYIWSLVERFEHDEASRELSHVRPGFFDGMLSSFTTAELFSNIEEAIDGYAHLARVDGSLILTTSLNLVGFGARIQDKPLPIAYVALDTVGSRVRKIDLTKFGTRHNAAAAFAQRFVNSLVYVCSQDGVASIFMRRGEKLVVWRPVDLEFSFDV